MDDELFTKKMMVETKTFIFDLKENPKGKYVKISELSHGKKDTIVIPVTGIKEFKTSLEEVIVEIEKRGGFNEGESAESEI